MLFLAYKMQDLNKAYDIFFATLSNKTRLLIITSLLKHQKNVSQLVSKTKFDQTTISHNLKRLEGCGFVRSKRNGKFKTYFLNKETIKPLIKLINKHINKYCRKRVK